MKIWQSVLVLFTLALVSGVGAHAAFSEKPEEAAPPTESPSSGGEKKS